VNVPAPDVEPANSKNKKKKKGTGAPDAIKLR
jgi:hypothetical protein